MHSDIELATLPAPIQRVLAKEAPAPVKLMAARGVIPGAKPGDIVTVVSVLAGSDDPKLAELARTTLSKLPAPILQGALTADLPGSVIAELARAYPNQHEVVTSLLRMPRISGDALEVMASAADERAGELIATNEELMLKHPTVIEKLYMNKRVRMSTADRLVELAVRHGLELDIPAFTEAAQAIKNELILEAAEEPYFDDVLFKEASQLGELLKIDEANPDTHEIDDEGEEKPKQEVLPLHAKLAQMTVSQKNSRRHSGQRRRALDLGARSQSPSRHRRRQEPFDARKRGRTNQRQPRGLGRRTAPNRAQPRVHAQLPSAHQLGHEPAHPAHLRHALRTSPA